MVVIQPKYTLDQYKAIVAAYSQGVTRVKYGDKEIDYRSVVEMERIIANMEIALGLRSFHRKKTIRYNKGLDNNECYR
ncbi:phage head-tail joining protein [Arachidicoccus terrestris]|uniref:phage head-tail joining protein n=1 Tax=Arachidicoccus terrestris TaxID=2875539 RepID=UPI0037433F87